MSEDKAKREQNVALINQQIELDNFYIKEKDVFVFKKENTFNVLLDDYIKNGANSEFIEQIVNAIKQNTFENIVIDNHNINGVDYAITIEKGITSQIQTLEQNIVELEQELEKGDYKEEFNIKIDELNNQIAIIKSYYGKRVYEDVEDEYIMELGNTIEALSQLNRELMENNIRKTEKLEEKEINIIEEVNEKSLKDLRNDFYKEYNKDKNSEQCKEAYKKLQYKVASILVKAYVVKGYAEKNKNEAKINIIEIINNDFNILKRNNDGYFDNISNSTVGYINNGEEACAILENLELEIKQFEQEQGEIDKKRVSGIVYKNVIEQNLLTFDIEKINIFTNTITKEEVKEFLNLLNEAKDIVFEIDNILEKYGTYIGVNFKKEFNKFIKQYTNEKGIIDINKIETDFKNHNTKCWAIFDYMKQNNQKVSENVKQKKDELKKQEQEFTLETVVLEINRDKQKFKTTETQIEKVYSNKIYRNKLSVLKDTKTFIETYIDIYYNIDELKELINKHCPKNPITNKKWIQPNELENIHTVEDFKKKLIKETEHIETKFKADTKAINTNNLKQLRKEFYLEYNKDKNSEQCKEAYKLLKYKMFSIIFKACELSKVDFNTKNHNIIDINGDIYDICINLNSFFETVNKDSKTVNKDNIEEIMRKCIKENLFDNIENIIEECIVNEKFDIIEKLENNIVNLQEANTSLLFFEQINTEEEAYYEYQNILNNEIPNIILSDSLKNELLDIEMKNLLDDFISEPQEEQQTIDITSNKELEQFVDTQTKKAIVEHMAVEEAIVETQIEKENISKPNENKEEKQTKTIEIAHQQTKDATEDFSELNVNQQKEKDVSELSVSQKKQMFQSFNDDEQAPKEPITQVGRINEDLYKIFGDTMKSSFKPKGKSAGRGFGGSSEKK